MERLGTGRDHKHPRLARRVRLGSLPAALHCVNAGYNAGPQRPSEERTGPHANIYRRSPPSPNFSGGTVFI